MRRLLIALVLLAGCGDGYATPPEREVAWDALVLRGDDAYVGYSHSSSIEDTRVSVHVDGSTAFVGIHARVPTEYVTADNPLHCFRVPLERGITRVARSDGSLPRNRPPRPGAPRERPADLLAESAAGGRCDDIPIDRSGDGA